MLLFSVCSGNVVSNLGFEQADILRRGVSLLCECEEEYRAWLVV